MYCRGPILSFKLVTSFESALVNVHVYNVFVYFGGNGLFAMCFQMIGTYIYLRLAFRSTVFTQYILCPIIILLTCSP